MVSITYKQNGTTVLGDLTYEYDKAGNRTRIGGSYARTGIPNSVSSTAYNAANHQTTFGDKTMTFDNNGNLQTITDPNGTTTYTWNDRNQLAGFSGPGMTASFVYDGIGRREKKTINGNLIEFLYDGLNPVQETSETNVIANIRPGFEIDEFFNRTEVPAGTTSYFLADALGSAIALTDSVGTVQTEYSYEPFGGTIATGVPSSNPFQYTGRENDAIGLFYYRARYYHPQLQRFVSEDPLFSEQRKAANLFVYVNNDPISKRDPVGLIPSVKADYNVPPLPPPEGNRKDPAVCPEPPVLAATGGPPCNLGSCLDACAAGGAAWNQFCRSLPDPRLRAGCWGLQFGAQAACRGWWYWNCTQ